MSQPWAKSLTYRQALDELTQRFDDLSKSDRVAKSELLPNLCSLDGYFFAINAAPAAVSPTQWLDDLLLLIQMPNDDPAQCLNLLVSYAVHSKKRMVQQKYALPLEADALKAMTPGSPMNSFCHGFELGHRKVMSIWSALTPEALRKELASQVFALCFFSSPAHAKRYLKDRKSDMAPHELADQVIKNWSKAADLHVRLGMSVEVQKRVIH